MNQKTGALKLESTRPDHMARFHHESNYFHSYLFVESTSMHMLV